MREKILDKEDEECIHEEIFTPTVKKRILWAILIQILIGNMMVSNLTAFLPTFCESNKWAEVDGVQTDVSNNDIGYIIASFSAAQVIFSPLNSNIKNYLGTKNTILIGLFLVMLSTCGLGAIANISNGNTFRSIALALRFV
jgi:MFS family permease